MPCQQQAALNWYSHIVPRRIEYAQNRNGKSCSMIKKSCAEFCTLRYLPYKKTGGCRPLLVHQLRYNITITIYLERGE